VRPISDPPLLRKFGSAGNGTRDLWNCSQELLTTRPQGGGVFFVLIHSVKVKQKMQPSVCHFVVLFHAKFIEQYFPPSIISTGTV
jgi:hypothetical protein